MILSSVPSAPQAPSPSIGLCRSITDVSSSKFVSGFLYPGAGKPTFGCSKATDVRQRSGRIPHWRPLKCRASGEFEVSSEGTTIKPDARANLGTGSPIVVVEAPPILKTAEPMPMMRPNTGLIKAGDAGRIIDRRPKDLWAVRFAVGAYLIEGKYFEPLTEE